MESTLFGSPASPKAVPHIDSLLAGFKAIEAGITFEQQGLRAKAQLDR
jgi:hypothetical protein